MHDDNPRQPAPNEADAPSRELPDLTGRDRMVRNVLVSWATHFVYVIAGFIMPRFIDQQIGQERLGVWDFGWSVVAYFGLVQGGVLSSVNRYVAKFRASGDIPGINRAVSSVTCVFCLMAAVVGSLTAVAMLVLPSLLTTGLGPHVAEARWVIALLGLSLSIQLATAGFAGVITGCHRWDLQNIIRASCYALTVVAMIVVLFTGGGLVGLALAILCGEALARVVRIFVAHRVCPGLKLRAADVSREMMRKMLAFSGKTLIPNIGGLLIAQTISILIVGYMGAAALALYTRPRSLIRQVTALVEKFAYVLTPTASSLQAMGQHQDLKNLYVSATRFGTYIALPLVILLVVCGDLILEIWMGPDYREGLVLTILAVGHLTWIVQLPVRNLLAGLNAHGRPGMANFIAAIISAAAAILVLGYFDGGLVGAALCVTVPLTVANGVYVPLYACRRIGISLWSYIRDSTRGPILCGIPFALCLMAGRFLYPDRALGALLCGGCTGTVVMATLYWRWVVPGQVKRSVSQWLRLGRPKPSANST
jgi:O-antigen/teichoic acid export membrane protein